MSCPICGKPTDRTYRPFCSKRCADVDLGRWLTERYRLPDSGEDLPDENDAPDDEPPPRPH